MICRLGVLTRELSLSRQWSAGLEYSPESWACCGNDLHAWRIHQRAEPVAAMICRLGVITRELSLSQQWSAGLKYSPESWARRSNDLQAWSTHQKAEPVAAMICSTHQRAEPVRAMISRLGELTKELGLSQQWSAGLEYSPESWACRSNDLQAFNGSWRSAHQRAEPVAVMICRLGVEVEGVLTRELSLSQQWSAGLE